MSTICRFPRGVSAALLLLITSLGASACGGENDGAPDARATDAREPDDADARALCYSGGGTPTPGAEVDLGIDRDGFTVLNENDEISLHRGNQGGYHLFVKARIRGLSAGDREQPPETNPATKFRAFTEDGEDITIRPCNYPLAYELDENGDWVMPRQDILQIDNRAVPDIYGRRMRITAEVVDAEGRYARDEEWVIVVAAVLPDASVPEPTPDASVSDAGVPDAATTAGN